MHNRILEVKLRHFVNPRHNDWNTMWFVPDYAINNFIQESNQDAPFFLTYDRHPRVPMHISLPESPTALNYVDTCNTDQAMQRATQCLQAAQQKQKRHANQHKCDLSFKVNDQVLLSTEHIPLHAVGTKKLLMK